MKVVESFRGGGVQIEAVLFSSFIHLLFLSAPPRPSEDVHHSCTQCLGIAYTPLPGGDLIRQHYRVSYQVGA